MKIKLGKLRIKGQESTTRKPRNTFSSAARTRTQLFVHPDYVFLRQRTVVFLKGCFGTAVPSIQICQRTTAISGRGNLTKTKCVTDWLVACYGKRDGELSEYGSLIFPSELTCASEGLRRLWYLAWAKVQRIRRAIGKIQDLNFDPVPSTHFTIQRPLTLEERFGGSGRKKKKS
ncbi:MAG: hypothetical protein M3X11_12460 [Acidobacteriota bacterium]|nr:hypothetical protein [Acidobacteriota bacterium]